MPQDRFYFYRDETIRGYRLVDTAGVPVGAVPPPEKEIILSDDQVLAILKGARHEEWLDRLVSSSNATSSASTRN